MFEHEKSKENGIVWTNGRVMTMDPLLDENFGLLESYDLVTHGSEIVAAVPKDSYEMPIFPQKIDLNSALVTPRFIGCHTHLVFVWQGRDDAQESPLAKRIFQTMTQNLAFTPQMYSDQIA